MTNAEGGEVVSLRREERQCVDCEVWIMSYKRLTQPRCARCSWQYRLDNPTPQEQEAQEVRERQREERLKRIMTGCRCRCDVCRSMMTGGAGGHCHSTARGCTT